MGKPLTPLAAAMRERCSAFAIDVLDEDDDSLDRSDVERFDRCAVERDCADDLPDEPPPGWAEGTRASGEPGAASRLSAAQRRRLPAPGGGARLKRAGRGP